MTDSSKYYVFYDGDCGLCNYWVQWILKNDHQKQFLFSALQSEFSQKFLKDNGFEKRGESYNGENDIGITYFEKKI